MFGDVRRGSRHAATAGISLVMSEAESTELVRRDEETNLPCAHQLTQYFIGDHATEEYFCSECGEISIGPEWDKQRRAREHGELFERLGLYRYDDASLVVQRLEEHAKIDLVAAFAEQNAWEVKRLRELRAACTVVIENLRGLLLEREEWEKRKEERGETDENEDENEDDE